MGVKMNLRIITKNRGLYLELGFLTKSILKPHGRAVAIPTVWELKTLLRYDPYADWLENFALISFHVRIAVVSKYQKALQIR